MVRLFSPFFSFISSSKISFIFFYKASVARNSLVDHGMPVSFQLLNFKINLRSEKSVFFYEKSCKIVLSAFCKTQKMVKSILCAIDIYCIAVSRAYKIFHSFASTISLFFSKNTFFCLYYFAFHIFLINSSPIPVIELRSICLYSQA